MSFTQDKFFKSLRLVLAISQSRVALGEVVIDYIQNTILPQLEDNYKKSFNSVESDKIANQIEMWSTYGDRNSPQGRSWNTDAVKVVASQARRFGISDLDAEDLANEIATEFYTKPYMRSMFDRYNINSGPIGLLKLFKKTISDRAMSILKANRLNMVRNVSLQTPTGEDGELGEMIPSPNVSELDNSEVVEVKKDMYRWMNKNLHGEVQNLFNLWFAISKEKDPSRINWSKEILPTWEEATGKSAEMLQRAKKSMFLKIVEYLEDVVGLDVNARTLKNLKLAAEQVAKNFWRRKFANWMLAPYYGVQALKKGK